MPPDFDIELPVPDAPEPEPAPDIPDTPTPPPDEDARRLREAEERAEAARLEAKRANELATRVAMAAFQGGGRHIPPEAPEPELPDPDEDPAAHRIAKVEKELRGQYDQGYRALKEDIGRLQQGWAQTEINRQRAEMRADPHEYPDYLALEGEIDALLSQYPPEHQATPNARANIYAYLYGQRQIEENRKLAKRAQATVTASGRGTPAAEPPPGGSQPTRLNPVQKAYAARESMTDGMFADMAGPGIMSIDEYRALKEKHAPKRKGA